MEQFKQIGEVLGSLKALMVFKDNIQINNRQCCLLYDIFNFTFESIAEEMRENLNFEEKNIKWKILEQPFKELHRVFKEGETYIKQCLETKDWWVKAIILYQNRDCIELCIHNLLCCNASVIEAIEMAGELSGSDQEEWQKKRQVYSIKYEKESRDPKIFQWRYGKQYLVSQEFCKRFENAWKEDRWILLRKIHEKKRFGAGSKRLAEILLKNLDDSELELLNGKLLPMSILVTSKDYQVRRRLGFGGQYKEISWLGESFAMRHILGDMEPLVPEISKLLSISHPNILDYFCGFMDEDKKECSLVMELMSRDLSTSTRKRVPFSLHVAVDLMLQISRGMEYLHLNKIYHGDLNPSNIFVKSRPLDGYLHAKITGFGLSLVPNAPLRSPSSNNNNGVLPFIWHAPEVLQEQEHSGIAINAKYTEKADVYSFGMVCFELLTGKVPFEDSHLQGEKMSRNIRAGERPLFPSSHSQKYITNLTKRCWHADPNQRPSFSSITRILRSIKRFLAMNPDYVMPVMDYCEIEFKLLGKFPSWADSDSLSVSKIPFQMFAYRVMEKERARLGLKESPECSGSEKTSISGDENTTPLESPVFTPVPSQLTSPITSRMPSPIPSRLTSPVLSPRPSGRTSPVLSPGPSPGPSRLPSPTDKNYSSSPEAFVRRLSMPKKNPDLRSAKLPGTPRGRIVRPPQIIPSRNNLRMKSESQLTKKTPRIRRKPSGNVSDSELS
ncbi:hypothetical protein ACFE04_018552 [Oxalis oulophora]